MEKTVAAWPCYCWEADTIILKNSMNGKLGTDLSDSVNSFQINMIEYIYAYTYAYVYIVTSNWLI